MRSRLPFPQTISDPEPAGASKAAEPSHPSAAKAVAGNIPAISKKLSKSDRHFLNFFTLYPPFMVPLSVFYIGCGSHPHRKCSRLQNFLPDTATGYSESFSVEFSGSFTASLTCRFLPAPAWETISGDCSCLFARFSSFLLFR